MIPFPFQTGGLGFVAPPTSGGGGGFPSLLSVTSTSLTTATTSHPISMPASVSNGDLLVCAVAAPGIAADSAVTTPSGWTALATAHSATAAIRQASFYRIANGTEGGTTVDFATAAAAQMAAAVIQYAASSYSGVPENVAQSNATSTTHAVPTLSPSWGVKDTSWIGGLGLRRPPNIVSYPYPDNQTAVNAMLTGTTGGTVVLCKKDEHAGSTPAGNFVRSTNNDAIAWVVAVSGP